MKSHTVYRENTKRENMVFHATFDCVTANDIVVRVQFEIDLRNLNPENKIRACKIVRASARFCKIAVPLNSDANDLYFPLRYQLRTWNTGSANEVLFLAFLQSLKSRYARITRAYKTNEREDRKLGIDFVVCFLSKPYYEEKRVLFNIKSSEHFLERHKERFPNISTFVFKKAYAESEDGLKSQFLRFLVRASKETVHM